jgi:hypothetical protein
LLRKPGAPGGLRRRRRFLSLAINSSAVSVRATRRPRSCAARRARRWSLAPGDGAAEDDRVLEGHPRALPERVREGGSIAQQRRAAVAPARRGAPAVEPHAADLLLVGALDQVADALHVAVEGLLQELLGAAGVGVARPRRSPAPPSRCEAMVGAFDAIDVEAEGPAEEQVEAPVGERGRRRRSRPPCSRWCTRRAERAA